MYKRSLAYHDKKQAFYDNILLLSLVSEDELRHARKVDTVQKDVLK
jgi:hypothetical protein